MLEENFIRNQIKTSNVKVITVLDSTNQYLLDHIEELHSGDTCIAEYQYKGRGRRGRKWFSPFGSNIYLSMYWHLEKGFRNVIGLSLAIGIVIAETLRNLGATQVGIKWPNDIYLRNRKLAGILVELSAKTNGTARVVVGIGINIKTQNRMQVRSMNRIWISLQEVIGNTDRNTLVVQIIKKLRATLLDFDRKGIEPFLSRWKQVDSFINCPVKLISGGRVIYGISRGINDQGALMLEEKKGIVSPWMGTEISLRSAEHNINDI